MKEIISHGYNVKGRIAVRTGKTMTIVDIAKESGYSVTTVSRVLNNRQDVSPAVKETIMKIVEAHNFVPNTNAKRLKQTISRNIYLLVKGTSNMLFANVVEEIQSIIDRTDYSLSITYLDEDSNLSSVTDRICMTFFCSFSGILLILYAGSRFIRITLYMPNIKQQTIISTASTILSTTLCLIYSHLRLYFT